MLAVVVVISFTTTVDNLAISINFVNAYTFLKLIIYLFLVVLGLRCCAWAFSSCSEQGLLFVEVWGLLTAVASLLAEHRL